MSSTMKVETGTRLLVQFKGEEELHERYATVLIGPGRWMMVSRDGDQYSHDLRSDFDKVIVMKPYAFQFLVDEW